MGSIHEKIEVLNLVTLIIIIVYLQLYWTKKLWTNLVTLPL